MFLFRLDRPFLVRRPVLHLKPDTRTLEPLNPEPLNIEPHLGSMLGDNNILQLTFGNMVDSVTVPPVTNAAVRL